MSTRIPAPAALLFCLSVVSHFSVRAQTDSFRLALTLPVQASFATTDNLGFIYLVTRQNAIEKYSPDGRLLTRYTNNRLGVAASLDVTNPLKVLVWYADFRTVVFLDRSLTILGELNLSAAGFPEVRAIAAAQDGNLWFYDEIRFHLRKISPEGAELLESQALNQLLDSRLQISCLRDNGNEVLAADTAAGLLWFDIYGQFQKLAPRKNIASFQLEQDRLIYPEGGFLHIERLQAPVARTLPLPTPAGTGTAPFWTAPRRIFIQNGEALEVWLWDGL